MAENRLNGFIGSLASVLSAESSGSGGSAGTRPLSWPSAGVSVSGPSGGRVFSSSKRNVM